MANTGTLSITGSYTNPIGANQQVAPGAQSYAAVVGATTAIALASGTNTITIPTGTTTVIIQLPTGNATSVTFIGHSGDTGMAMGVTSTWKFDPASSVTSFGLTAGSAISALTFITFL